MASITKGDILRICANQDVYDRGQRYYNDGKIISYTQSKEGVTAVIEGHYKNYNVGLVLDKGQGVSSYTCSCASHSIWQGACKHVVAALFALFNGQGGILTPAQMRKKASTLANKLEEVIYDNIEKDNTAPEGAESVTAQLVPTLRYANNNLQLTVSIGRSRMYGIKNLSNFIGLFKTEEMFEYGKSLTLVHKLEAFDGISQKFLKFIMGELDTLTEINRQLSRQFRYGYPPLIIAKELQLTRRNIDAFFEIFKGRTMQIDMEGSGSIKLTTALPDIVINISHVTEGTTIQIDPFSYELISGSTHCYMLTNTAMHCIAEGNGELLNQLLKAVETAPNREILFEDDNQEKFLTVVLPQLKRMGMIANIEGVEPDCTPKPLNTKMYFDICEKTGRDIIGRVEFIYGTTITDPFTQINNRDIIAEYKIRRKLATMGFFEDKYNKIYKLVGDDLTHDFLYQNVDKLSTDAEVFMSQDLQGKVVKAQAPKIGIRLSGDLLKLTMEDSGYDITELLEALEAYRVRKKYHRLKDGRFLSLTDDAVVAAAEFLDALDITKSAVKGKAVTMPAYRALYVDSLTKVSQLAQTHGIKQNTKLESLIDGFKNKNALNFKVPKDGRITATLREYQKEGFYWLKTLAHYKFGGILADDMGLGKTLQVITVLASEIDVPAPSIVVCPTSLLFNWEKEIGKFAPGLKVEVISGGAEKRHDTLMRTQAHVIITTYDMLKRDIEYYRQIHFNYIIADEAQNIKNPSTQAAQSIKELRGNVRFALTGTPIENTLTELWSIFDFIMPGYLHSAHKFGKLYETPIVKHADIGVTAKLRQQIAPFVLRRIKETVLKELPEKTETTLPAEQTPGQKMLYQANLLEAIGAFKDITQSNTFTENRMKILAQLTRLRQICCHPSLFLEDYDGGSGKLNLALETIQISLESGHRVLLFSQFTSMLEIIKTAMVESGLVNKKNRPVEYFYLDGTIKPKERMEMTTRFNEGEGDVFLISLKAGGAGLNLTGADVVIHFDPWWNPSVMDQASDRAHRYGQKKAVQVFNIVAKDSIEEKIMELQERKRGLIDSVITEGGSFINVLSEEEVRKLFEE